MARFRNEIGEEFDIRIAQVGARADDIVNRIDVIISEKFRPPRAVSWASSAGSRRL